MADLNEEMRDLICKEREAYEDELIRQDEERRLSLKQLESKQKIMKNRLLMAIGAIDNMELEEAVKVAAEMLQGGRPVQTIACSLPTQGSFHGETPSPINRPMHSVNIQPPHLTPVQQY
jgi:hypothetical protein